jgi:hypothetical protein
LKAVAGTKRVPINRPSKSLQITAHVLQLFFERTEVARGQRDIAIINCDVNPYGFCRMECTVCQDWSAAHAELHEVLGLRPWQWPCLPFNPFPPNSPKSQDWRPSKSEWELWHVLERERAQRAAQAGAPDASIESGSTTTAPAAK